MKKILTNMLLQNILIVLESTLTLGIVVVIVVEQRLSHKILHRDISESTGVNKISKLLTRQCSWWRPSTFAGKPPPFSGRILTWSGASPTWWACAAGTITL